MKYTPMYERFFAKIDKSGECWLWTGTLNGKYGVLTCPGNSGGVYAHRYSYMIHFGEIPPDHMVCHTCDVPTCVRPDHLFAGTAADNMSDRDKKRRQAHGTRHGNSRLTEDDVRTIRTELAGGGVTQTELAKRYGVRQGTISAIKTGRLWSSLK